MNNVEVFKHTYQMCQNNELLNKAIHDSINNQILYQENDLIPMTLEFRHHDKQVVISKNRALFEALNYRNKQVAILNFASFVNPGGGVIHGAKAQEECLCRASTLFPCLNDDEMWRKFYLPHRQMNNPLYNDDLIYTPNVVVFKKDDGSYDMLNEEDYYHVNVITCAAPNLYYHFNISDEELYAIHLKRGRRILDVARAHHNDVIVLGAFGCGAFRNPPQVVAKAYKQLVDEYKQYFDVIAFAIYCHHDQTNYEVFKKELSI